MNKNPSLEQIAIFEAEIAGFRDHHTEMHTLYQADGVIDADEEDVLNRIEQKIAEAQEVIATLRHTYEQNKKLWQDRRDDLSHAQDGLIALNIAAHPEAKSVREEYRGVLTCAREERWTDACTALDALLVRVQPLFEEADAEGAAAKEYQPNRRDYDERVAYLDRTSPQPDFLVEGLRKLADHTSKIDAAKASQGFQKANEALAEALKTLAPIEAQQEQYEFENQDFESALKGIEDQLFEVLESRLPQFATQRDAIQRKSDKMYELIAVPDTAAAKPILLEIIREVEALYPELIKQEGSKDEFFHDYPPLEKRAKAVEHCELEFGPDLVRHMLDTRREIEGFVDAGDYASAVNELTRLEGSIKDIEALFDEPVEYKVRKAALATELAQARVVDPRTAYIKPQQEELEKVVADMEKDEADSQFFQALGRMDRVEVLVAEILNTIAQKKKDSLHRQKSFHAQYAEATRDLTKETKDEYVWITLWPDKIDKAIADEDWAKALKSLDKAFDRLGEFNKEMLRGTAGNMTDFVPEAAMDIVGLSPELTQSIQDLEKDGWRVEVGKAGKGTHAQRGIKLITIDANDLGNPRRVVQALAHEVGHAEDHRPPDWSSREAFIHSMLLGEAEAVMENIRIQRELLANGHQNIKVSGHPSAVPTYEAAYDQYLKDGDTMKALETIATKFGPIEVPSGNDHKCKNYIEYYGKQYDELHDKSGAK